MNKSRLIGRYSFEIDHRLLREKRVGCQARHQVDREAGNRPMSGVFDLRHVLQLVVDGLDQCSFAQENLVSDSHNLSLHIVLQLCNQLNTIHEESGEKFLADVSLVSNQFAEYLLDERFVAERLPVVDITGCDHEVQQITLLVTDEMQFEAVEPADRALAPLGKSLEDLVQMDALVPAYPQGGTVDETDSRAASHAASLHEQDERDGHLSLQFDKAVVGYGLWKQVGHILANLIQVKVFQTFISTQVEEYHNGYHLGIGQRGVPMVLPLGLVPDGSKAVDLDKSVINAAEVIRHTENFRNFVFSDRHSESLCVWFVAIPNLQKLSLFS